MHTQIRVAHDLSEAILQTIKDRHINLALMGWKGTTNTPGRVFSRVVDTIIRQAACEVVLVKLKDHSQFNRWLVPMAGGPNAQQAIKLLPAIASLSKTPEVKLCQVFESDNNKPDTTILEKEAHFLKQRLHGSVSITSICATSVPEAVLECASQNHSDVIVLGASREGMLQQAVNGNIPAAISRHSQQTVILVRAASAVGTIT